MSKTPRVSKTLRESASVFARLSDCQNERLFARGPLSQCFWFASSTGDALSPAVTTVTMRRAQCPAAARRLVFGAFLVLACLTFPSSSSDAGRAGRVCTEEGELRCSSDEVAGADAVAGADDHAVGLNRNAVAAAGDGGGDDHPRQHLSDAQLRRLFDPEARLVLPQRVSARAYGQLKHPVASSASVRNADLARAARRTREKLRMRDNDIIIVSYPKSEFAFRNERWC